MDNLVIKMKNKSLSFVKHFDYPLYFFENTFKFKKFEKFPIIQYSNGSPCLLANIYLQTEKNISLSEQSLYKLAYSLTHIIRYIELKKVDFKDIDDNFIMSFSDYLQNERDDTLNILRNGNTINYILVNTLNFLTYIGEKFLGIPNYGSNILNISEKDNNFKNKSDYQPKSIYHKSFVRNEPLKTRSPIALKDIESLYSNIDKLSQSKFVRKRMSMLLKLLECTGARIGEISELKVVDIENLMNKDDSLLKIRTLKTRNGVPTFRYVPVQKNDFNEVMSYIKIYRSKIIKETIGKSEDNGFLFVNENTGNKLLAITLSNDINRLRKISGIEQQICAHMFRHRYITNLFINLIKQYDLENQDDFRNALLDINNLKVYIQQATGHKDVNSLDHYIHIAKSELTNMSIVKENLNNVLDFEAKQKEEQRLLKMLKNKEISTKKYIELLENL